MTSINVYLRENLPGVSPKRVHIAPNIDRKKLGAAVAAFGYEGDPNRVVALFDNTFLGTGKDGMLFTGKQLIFRPSFGAPVSIEYGSIASVEYTELVTGSKGDKTQVLVLVRKKNGEIVSLQGLSECNYRKLAEVLQHAFGEFEVHEEVEQFVPLDSMGEELKVAYVKCIINMAFENDGRVDEKELAEILLLMRRIRLTTESRFSLREYMGAEAVRIPLQDLLETIDTVAPIGQSHAIHLSLVKDLFNVHLSTGGKAESFPFFEQNRSLLMVPDNQVELAIDAIHVDHKMIREDVTDAQMVTIMKALSAKSAAVGVPLAAVYLTGSVAGLSAAGLTSGLATLGMGGVLGLSSMATGVGVAVLLGVGAYAGVRHLTGANEVSQSKRRELMLAEIIKQTQGSISLLMEDINYICSKLNAVVHEHVDQDRKMQHLADLLQQLTGAGVVLTEKNEVAHASVARMHCPAHLDLAKVRMLSASATMHPVRDFILGCYEEALVAPESPPDAPAVTKQVLRTDLTRSELEALEQAFDEIGYFKVAELLGGVSGELAAKTKRKLSDLLS